MECPNCNKRPDVVKVSFVGLIFVNWEKSKNYDEVKALPKIIGLNN